MERSVDEMTSSRVRALIERFTGRWEVATVAAATVVVWRLALGWDWSSVQSNDPTRLVAPQSGLDWLMLGIAVAAGIGWLSWRGYAVAGTAAIWTPVVLLSGWRLAASGILGWPISLASLIFVVSAIAIVAAAVGTWLRPRRQDGSASGGSASGGISSGGSGEVPEFRNAAKLPVGRDASTADRAADRVETLAGSVPL
jgi:hypothetical protein